MNQEFWEIKGRRADYGYLTSTPSTLLDGLLLEEEVTELAAGPAILDAGSGTGTTSLFLAEQVRKQEGSCSLYCLDYSPEMLKRARASIEQRLASWGGYTVEGGMVRQNQLSFSFVSGSLTSLPSSIPPVDGFLCLNVMQEFSLYDMACAANELSRIIKSGGVGYINFIWDLPFKETFTSDRSVSARILERGGRVFIDGIYKNSLREGERVVINEQTCISLPEMVMILAPFCIEWAKVISYDRESIRRKYGEVLLPDKFDQLCDLFGGFPDSYLFKVRKYG